MDRIIFLDPCPDSVWEQLPGGPAAWTDVLGEVWQYTGTILHEDGRARHEFRHRAHPAFDGTRTYAHVIDDDCGPLLARLIVNGREIPLTDGPPGPWRSGTSASDG